MIYLYDEPGVYAIQVVGRVDKRWSDRLGGLTIVHCEPEGENTLPITSLIGPLADQAALHGVIEILYNNRFPLLLVTYLRPSVDESLGGVQVPRGSTCA